MVEINCFPLRISRLSSSTVVITAMNNSQEADLSLAKQRDKLELVFIPEGSR